MLKRALICLAFLVMISCLLLEVGNACYYGPPPQLMGEIVVPDSTCASGLCRQEYIYWRNEYGDYEYVPQGCVTCPVGTSTAQCGQ
jgi:hypothetical protein